MRIGKPTVSAIKTKVVVITPDPAFEAHARATFAASAHIELALFSSALTTVKDTLDFGDATVIIVDLDARRDEELAALQAFVQRVGAWPPVVAVTQAFDAGVARTLLQMRVADFLVKPVAALDLVEACARVAKAPSGQQNAEAQIFTFLPAVGGGGVTTLAIQTAMALLNSGARGKTSTCLVDLDFQHGACSDYLDLEPRLNLSEIEPRPERLDRQLLEVMLSHHASGLSVISAPNQPAEMRSFNPDVVTRLLDLVSAQFDYVVFDMPRTWFSWTDSVLLGSNRLYIVSEMTVPGLRRARNLVEAIGERLGGEVTPKVIINRFEQSMFSSGLRKSDIVQTLGDSFACAIPNHYSLVREAIDRGVPLEEVKPGNRISQEIKKLVASVVSGKAATPAKVPFLGKLKVAASR